MRPRKRQFCFPTDSQLHSPVAQSGGRGASSRIETSTEPNGRAGPPTILAKALQTVNRLTSRRVRNRIESFCYSFYWAGYLDARFSSVSGLHLFTCRSGFFFHYTACFLRSTRGATPEESPHSPSPSVISADLPAGSLRGETRCRLRGSRSWGGLIYRKSIARFF